MAHPEDHTRRARRCLHKTVSNPSELCTAAPTAEGAGRLRPSNTSALPTHVWKLSEKPGEKPRQPGQIVLASSSTFWDHGFAVETCKREASWWLSACVHFVSAATSEDHTEFSDQSFRLCYQRMWCLYPQMESV